MASLGGPAGHESARLHVSGEARYVADLALPPGGRFGVIVPAGVAHGRLRGLAIEAAAQAPGIDAVLTARDLPGENWIGPMAQDEPLLAAEEICYAGQPVALVLGRNELLCRRAAALVEVEIEALPALLSIDEALAAGSFSTEPHVIARGDVDAALAGAAQRIRAELRIPLQDHFYLETQAALVEPREHGAWLVQSSTQHPSEVQHMVARVLGIGRHRVSCEVPRMGGAFGGKESQANSVACLASLGAHHLRRGVKVCLRRDEDMAYTGKRHPFLARYEMGFDSRGGLTAAKVQLFADGGFSLDLSPAILSRALFHLDNAYFIPALRFEGRVVRTHLPSNTAFRGFGGPQGMLVIEDALNNYCEEQGEDPNEIRARNFYGPPPRDRAPYGMEVVEPRLARIYRELLAEADYESRRAALAEFNAHSTHLKRGLAFQPVKFGISFTNRMLNQAGALVQVYADGTVQLNHGGTEMGQGLHAKMIAVCADQLGIEGDRVCLMPTSTEKVPNTSPTAASSGSDLNGAAIADACAKLRHRLEPIATELLGVPADTPLRFRGGGVEAGAARVGFAELTRAAWIERVSLSATGFYRTPHIQYDQSRGQGRPFHYFAYGGALVEVEVLTLTGEHRLLRVDILHDVGNSLLPSIDRGQIEGGFIQGMGWLTCEDFQYGADGRAITVGPSLYKIPSAGDLPEAFAVRFLGDAAQPGVIGGSKAVGEPPLMLAIGVWTALRQAVLAARGGRARAGVALPATPEALLRALAAD